MRSIFLKSLLILLISNGCSVDKRKHVNTKSNAIKPISVIFETDMGNDVDDALALDMLYKYIETKKINVLSIMTNKNSVYSAEFIDLMSTWYGHPNIPIGIMKGGPNSEDDAINYAKAVSILKDGDAPLFKRTIKDHQSLPEAHILYRKLLANQPDSSVVIVSVGFSTNLVRLLATKPDKYSPLSGRDLVAKKVKLLSAMLGSFTKVPIKEYNVVVDIPAAKKMLTEWPSHIVVSPFEVGNAVHYPATSIQKDFNWIKRHPLVEAYKSYLPMPYDRPTWDLTSLLYVADFDNSNMTLSPVGLIKITDEGYSEFQEQANGKHTYLSINAAQAEKLKSYFVKTITSKPLKYQNHEN